MPQLHRAEQAIADGQRLDRTDPRIERLAFICPELNRQPRELRKDPKNRVAFRDYDFALSRVFSTLRDTQLDPWTHPLHVPAPNGGDYVLADRPTGKPVFETGISI